MKAAPRTMRQVPAEDAFDDLDPVHLDWSDIPPPRDIIRARRDGHLVRIPKPVLVLTKFYVRHWLQTAGLGDHFQDGDI